MTAQLGVQVTMHDIQQLQLFAQQLYVQKSMHSHSRGRLGQKVTRHLGHGMAFDALRLYQPGDDVRHIHWRVTARTGKAYSKLFTEDRERPFLIYLDLGASMYFGTRQHFKSALAIKLACVLIWYGVMSQEKVGCIIRHNDETFFFPPTCHLYQLLAIFKQLSTLSVEYAQVNHLTPLVSLDRFRYCLPSGARLLVVADVVGDVSQWAERLLYWRRQFVMDLFWVQDNIECRYDVPGYYPVWHQNQCCIINMQDRTLREKYELKQKERRVFFEGICQRSQVRIQSVMTDCDWQRKIKEWSLI